MMAATRLKSRLDKDLNEECAVFGVSLKTEKEAAGITYNGLLSLQHRGQEGAGIAVVSTGDGISCVKDTGLVSEVFSGNTLETLPKSRIAVGHTRYSTTGSNTKANVQPFITEYLTGRIATVHNGNITNAKQIRDNLKNLGLNFSATSDTEVVSSLIAYRCMESGELLKGILNAASELEGAYSLIVMSGDGRLAALRDPYGFRPLCLGTGTQGTAIASESCALESCGFSLVRDILPGEAILVENGAVLMQGIRFGGNNSEDNGSGSKNGGNGRGICIFEFVYFARPDSIIDNMSVYEARYNMGRILAGEYPVDADSVCGVPDSGLEAAMGYSAASGLPLVSGFVKNRYIGRSFIYPVQAQRENAVRLKLNPLSANIKGRRIVLVDDSIVRGTTSRKITGLLREAGAKEVHMRISSPPFRYTCHYGTDIDDADKLIANRMDIKAICEKIGADSLGYISISGLKKACSKCSVSFCTHCFTGCPAACTRKNILEEL